VIRSLPSTRKHLSSAAAILLIALSVTTRTEAVSAASATADTTVPVWSMFRHDALHTGRSTFDVRTDFDFLQWKVATGGSVVSSPAIASDGTIYIGSGDDHVYALNPGGSLKWKFATGQSVLSSPAIGGDGTIYVGSDDKHLYALNPNGTLKWKFATGNDVSASPVLASDGTIYVGSLDAFLYAVNPDGSLKWKFKSGRGITSSAAIGANGTIFVGCSDSNLYAINPDGSLKWKFFLNDGNVGSSPAVAPDGTIYIGGNDTNHNGMLFAINSNGTQKWVFPYGERSFNKSSPALGPDGSIYVGSGFGVYKIAPNGTKIWNFKDNLPVLGINAAPALSGNAQDGTVIVGTNGGVLYALRTDDGSVRWRFVLKEPIFSSPALGANGTVYFGSKDRHIYAIGGDFPPSWPSFRHDGKHTGQSSINASGTTGVSKWKFTTAGLVTSSPATSGDLTIYVGSLDNNLYALNPDGTQSGSSRSSGEFHRRQRYSTTQFTSVLMMAIYTL
jgi:outer membrane protein assembly factor BamB